MSIVSLSRLATLLVAATTAALVAAPSAPAVAGPGVPPTARVVQRAEISVLPPIAQVGSTTAPSTRAGTVISTTVTPAVHGRPVVLARKHHGRWRVVDRTTTTREGLAEFTARTRARGKAVRYRTTALAYRTLPKVNSSAVWSTTWGAPDFVDEFDAPALDARWQHRIQFLNPWGGRSCSRGAPEATAVESGALRLSVLPDPTTSELCTPTVPEGSVDSAPTGTYRYRINGHVSTEDTADFMYGVAAARMKFQQARGQHASFWLQPRGLLKFGTTPWGAEIDVIEYFGEDERRGGLMTNVYRPSPGGAKIRSGTHFGSADRFLAGRSDAWWKNYHVFSVEWTPTEYVFRIDGHETWRTSEGISHHPQFLILSLLSSDDELAALGGEDDIDENAYVDWVQFWQAG